MQKQLLPATSHRWICQEINVAACKKASRILKNIDGIAHIELDEDDVVRHRLVKHILRAYDKERKEEEKRENDKQ